MLRPRRLAFRPKAPVGERRSPHSGVAGLRNRGPDGDQEAIEHPARGTAVLRCAGMSPRARLVAVSAVQLAANLTGQVVALRRRRHFDVPFMTGSPEHVARDSLWFGTAYSAPAYMLGPQAWAVARLLRGPDERARWVLTWLGTGMTAGYPSERWNRMRLRPSGFDPVETPMIAIGWAGSVAMAVVGRLAQARP